MTGSISGFPVQGVELNYTIEGGTNYRKPIVGLRGVVTAFVGYLGPSIFGLGAAKLITLGHSIAALWLAVIFLVLLLLNLGPLLSAAFRSPSPSRCSISSPVTYPSAFKS